MSMILSAHICSLEQLKIYYYVILIMLHLFSQDEVSLNE